MKSIAVICFSILGFSLVSCGSDSTPASNSDIDLCTLITTKYGAEIATNYGSITLELYPDKAPITVANFLDYVNSGFYENTIFHRVIPNFMAQGGGFTESLVKKSTNPPIVLESNNGLSNLRGTIAMARTSVPDSATSQFFINVVDNLFLDYQSGATPVDGYAVFGKVTAGMDTVDTIVNLQTYAPTVNLTDVPVNAAIISKATEINCAN